MFQMESNKYGFGYSLNDDSIGVVFNDLTILLLLADGQNIHYIDYERTEVTSTVLEQSKLKYYPFSIITR